MAKWSRELIINNFYYLASQKGISLKEFEESAGEKAGYLARMKKSDIRISAEFFVKACDILSVSMDLVASTDLSSMPEQETFTYDFLKRLTGESSNKDWKQLLGKWEQKYNSEHDIFETNIPFEQLPEIFFEKPEDIPEEAPQGIILFNSLYNNNVCYKINAIYNLKINDQSYLALAETVYNNKTYKELYLVNEGTLKGIACTSGNQCLNNLLNELLQNIKQKLDPLSLNDIDIKLLNSIF